MFDVHNYKSRIIYVSNMNTKPSEIELSNVPDTKEDIVWLEHVCEDCNTVTGYMQGDEPQCAKCCFDNAAMAEQESEIRHFPSIDDTDIKERYCLQDVIDSTDPQTLAKVRSECADLGCNVCLADTSFDEIEWPKHYNQGKIQPIDVIEDWKLDFRLANTIKYIARAGKKDPRKTKQDLEKAIWYIQRYIDKEL